MLEVERDLQELTKEYQAQTKEIEKIRTDNTAVGLRVSRLFFVLTDLTNVDPMYQYSLDFFKHIFEMTLKSADEAGYEKGGNQAKANRRAYWIREFTRRLYSNVSRSLFQRHILLFSFLICLKIMDEIAEGGLNIGELRFLMAGAT